MLIRANLVETTATGLTPSRRISPRIRPLERTEVLLIAHVLVCYNIDLKQRKFQYCLAYRVFVHYIFFIVCLCFFLKVQMKGYSLYKHGLFMTAVT